MTAPADASKLSGLADRESPYRIYWDRELSFHCDKCGKEYFWVTAPLHRSASPKSEGMQVQVIQCTMPVNGGPCGRVHIRAFNPNQR